VIAERGLSIGNTISLFPGMKFSCSSFWWGLMNHAGQIGSQTRDYPGEEEEKFTFCLMLDGLIVE
jgi:hypothetical protein